MKSYTEYKEEKIPDNILKKLEQSVEDAQNDPANNKPLTLGEAGVIDWINGKAKEGWQPVWQTFAFPVIVFEREIFEEEK